MRTPFKIFGIVAVCFVLGLVAFGIWLFGPHRADIGNYKLESGVEVRLFVEAGEFGDILYYQIRNGGKQVVRTTYLTGHDRKIPLHVQSASSADKTVLGMWADGKATGDFPIFILYHVPSGESWPRLRYDEVEQKWHARYSSLRASHPELPVPNYFREAANQSIQRTFASRLAQSQIKAQWRLAPAADAHRSARKR